MWTPSHFPILIFLFATEFQAGFFLKAYISKNNHLKQTKKNRKHIKIPL